MNQHYVPKVYLRNFATPKGDEYYVDVYSKEEKRIFPTNIKNICAEQNLYTLKELEGNELPLSVEKFYSDYQEPIYSRAYNLLTNDKTVRINQIQRTEIILGVFQFYFRNPLFLQQSAEFHIRILKAQVKREKLKGKTKTTYLNVDYNLEDLDLENIEKELYRTFKEGFKKTHIQAFQELSIKQSEIVINVWKLSEDYDYITSDKPLCLNNNISKGNVNPFEKSQHFYLPLNYRYCVFLYHEKTKRKDIIHRQKVYNLKSTPLNANQFENSDRFIIGRRDILEKFISEYEVISKPITEESLYTALNSLVTNFPITKENKDVMSMAKEYLEKRKKYGKWSNREMNEIFYHIDMINKRMFANKL